MTRSSSATFITRFCSSLNREIIFVRTKNGTYSKYTFNTMTNQFLAANCSDCRIVPSEADLFPLYAAWSNRLERYVIFVKNSLNGKVEQYVYEKDYEGFQQVSQPELQFDENRTSTSNDFFGVGGTEEEGATVIRRDATGHFSKEQLNWGTKKFEKLPAVPVKILVAEEKKETIPVTVDVPVEKIKEIASGLERREQKENQILRVNTVRITAPLRKRKSALEKASGDNAKKEVAEKDEPKEPPRKPVELQLQRAGTKTKLSARDITEIRRIAALMGNPVKSREDDEDSSDDADYTSDSDYDDLPSTKGEPFDVVESSC